MESHSTRSVDYSHSGLQHSSQVNMTTDWKRILSEDHISPSRLHELFAYFEDFPLCSDRGFSWQEFVTHSEAWCLPWNSTLSTVTPPSVTPHRGPVAALQSSDDQVPGVGPPPFPPSVRFIFHIGLTVGVERDQIRSSLKKYRRDL